MRSHRDTLIWTILGILGAALLVWAFPRAFPLLPKSAQISEPEARLLAFEAMRELGEPVVEPYVVVQTNTNVQLERRLQWLSSEIGTQKLASSRIAASQVVWDVLVYAPGAQAGRWTYRALISLHGEVVSVRKRETDTTASEIDDETARRLGVEYLLEQGFELAEFETPGEIRRSQQGLSSDVRLQLRSKEAALGSEYPYGIEIYFAGEKVAGFGWWFEDPDPAAIEQALRQRQIFNLSFIVVLILLLPAVAVPFLKRYHDGQLGVRRGVQILLLTLFAAAVYTILNQDSISEGANIGFLTRRQTAWLVPGLSFLVFYFTSAVLALMSWSVGEYFCRQNAPQKLASIDALFRGKWANRTVARSSLMGVVGGLCMTGLLLALTVAGRSAGVWAISGSVHDDMAGHILGWFSIFAERFADVVPIYIFAVFLMPSFVGARLGKKAAFVTAWLMLTLTAPTLISMPLEGSWAIWAAVALVPAALFHFGDLFAAVLSGVVSQIVLATLPGFFADDLSLVSNAWAVLLLAASPLIFSARHLLLDEEFVYTYDDVPPHVRRIAERERQRLEIETAAEIQSSILPELPEELSGVEIACAYRPATEVGGDFYDVLALDDGRLAVAVGDVAGHGVSSGLVMSMAKSALAVQVTFDPEVESVFRTLNRMVYQNARRRLLATLCYALVDPRRLELHYASAGHLYPYRVSLAGQVHGLETASYPLGVRGAIRVDVRNARLAPSDTIFLCSDGLVEACPEDNEEPFGFDRLEAGLKRNAGRTPAQIRDALLTDVEAYCGRRPWEDDLTILVLRLPAA